MSAQVAPVSLVTGGARGIGAAVARRLSKAGHRVIVADRDKGPEAARFVQADVSDETAVRDLIRDIAGTEAGLDHVICNAGIMIRKPIAYLSLKEWEQVLATNLTSAFLLAREAEPLLRAAKGSIVTIGSTRAHMSEPNTEAYAASKGGLVALTHALAMSLGPDVRVNCISPGWIYTKGVALRPEDHSQHPAGRVGTPDDIASLVAWLVGDESGFVTGAEFVVDGGMTRKMIYAH